MICDFDNLSGHRPQVKLQQYRDMVKDGQELTKDQVQAASHFDEVVSNLEFAKELHKTFTVTMSEVRLKGCFHLIT